MPLYGRGHGMDNEVGQLLRTAGEAMRTGQKQVARQCWGRVLEREDGHPVALNGLGMLALADNAAAEAAAMFRRAAESDPNALVLWMNHARATRMLGDEAAEKASLLQAIRIDPRALIVNIRLAEHAERNSDSAAALERWRAVVAITEGNAEVPVEARAAVEHGRQVVADHTAQLNLRIDGALAARRAGLNWAQRRRIDGAIDHMFGKRPIYVNSCSGLHIPFLPADEYFDRSLLPWLTELEAGTDVIRAELLTVLGEGGRGFEPYVQLPPGTPQNVWSSLDGSSDWNTLHLWRHGRRDEAACARFPKTAELVQSLPLATLPDRMPTVFFSVLAPHAHIPPHTGVTNARAIVHLPLIVPPGCRFRVGGETRAWVEGEAFAFDDTIEHEAWNDSDERRVILILDTWNPYLTEEERALLLDFYSADRGDAGAL
jgi:aspartate beta-hydroxylase